MITNFEVIADNVIDVYTERSWVARRHNAKTLGYVMNMYGLADETKMKGGNGLPYNDDIFDEALAIYNWETNGVAG